MLNSMLNKMLQKTNLQMNSKLLSGETVARPFTTLRRLPVDILAGHFDVACFTMDATVRGAIRQ
jgi:hypothetical protein